MRDALKAYSKIKTGFYLVSVIIISFSIGYIIAEYT